MPRRCVLAEVEDSQVRAGDVGGLKHRDLVVQGRRHGHVSADLHVAPLLKPADHMLGYPRPLPDFGLSEIRPQTGISQRRADVFQIFSFSIIHE